LSYASESGHYKLIYIKNQEKTYRSSTFFLRRRSTIGQLQWLVVKDCELFGVLMHWSTTKYQISSTKLQTNLKFQYSMTKTNLKIQI